MGALRRERRAVCPAGRGYFTSGKHCSKVFLGCRLSLCSFSFSRVICRGGGGAGSGGWLLVRESVAQHCLTCRRPTQEEQAAAQGPRQRALTLHMKELRQMLQTMDIAWAFCFSCDWPPAIALAFSCLRARAMAVFCALPAGGTGAHG